MLLGSHLSVAGGLDRAAREAQRYGFRALALFVSSPRQWHSPALSDSAAAGFRLARQEAGILKVVAHASYLLNLAATGDLRSKSLTALGDDLDRCAALGIEYLVFHPGAHSEAKQGMRLVAEGMSEVLSTRARSPVRLLVESTAGQGNSLGHRFEHLAEILDGVPQRKQTGICLDTCHLFAAGYDMRTAPAWRKTIAEFDRTVGLARLFAVHCNDSLKPLGSRRDRHAHIGEGEIGRKGFAALVNDQRFQGLPLILETPKEKRESDGRDWDEINAETLQSLLKKK